MIQVLDFYTTSTNHTDSIHSSIVSFASFLKSVTTSTSDLSLFIKSTPYPIITPSSTIAAALNSTLAFATKTFSSYSDPSPTETSQILLDTLSIFRVLANSSDKPIKKVRLNDERRISGAKRQQYTAYSFDRQPSPRSLRSCPKS